MVITLVVLAVMFGAAGLLFLSGATAGVGLIAFACLLGICARIAQAAEHRRATMPVPVDTRPPDVLQAIKQRQDRLLYILAGGFVLSAVLYVAVMTFAPNLVAGLFAR